MLTFVITPSYSSCPIVVTIAHLYLFKALSEVLENGFLKNNTDFNRIDLNLKLMALENTSDESIIEFIYAINENHSSKIYVYDNQNNCLL